MIRFYTKDLGFNNFVLLNVRAGEKAIERARVRVGNDCFMLDPSVMYLRSHPMYSANMLDKLEYWMLRSVYTATDYPADMNLSLQRQFIEMTDVMNEKYAEMPTHIYGLQSKFLDSADFKGACLLASVSAGKRLVGVGNLCRILRVTLSNLEYCRSAIVNIKDLISQGFKVHVYGPSFQFMCLMAKMDCVPFSVDSTKWTRAVNKSVKERACRVCSTKATQSMFFDAYIDALVLNGFDVHP